MRSRALMASAAMIVAIALADWWTPTYVSLGFLYLFPIMLAAGFLPRRALLAQAMLCAVLSETFSALDPEGRAGRLILETLALAGCGLFVSELLRNRRLGLETEARLRALFETSPAAIVTLDQHGTIEAANRAAVELLVPCHNLMGQSIASYLPELQKALRPEAGAQFRASMRCPVCRCNGETLVAEVWFSTYHEKGSPKLAAIIADVTEDPTAGIRCAPVEAHGMERASLNARQVAILRLVFEGLSNHEMESRLKMTPSAVKNTLQQLFSKTGARNRSQMVRVALERYRDLL
ncbi:MAG TPA: PAS domain S-box protein [Bryobacteraceae bacterium]|nr:PAS domain S-box protein [Bryobacteraceae bacterium]